MNANELADALEAAPYYTSYEGEAATMLRQQQAEIEALKKTNGQLVGLVQLQREDAEKMRNEILAWENADVPVETMADIIEELERRGFITK